MDKSIFKDKKIIFYGPAKTSDKKTIDISYYDYAIITNNMIDIFFNKYNQNLSCKIILLANQLYSINYAHIIKKYNNKIDIILTIGKGYNYLKNLINNVNIYKMSSINVVKGVPLGLTRILELLNNQKFKELYISGVTFYNGRKIEDCYENNYMIEHGKKCNVFNNRAHNISSNIRYTKKILYTNKNILICNELHNILKFTYF